VTEESWKREFYKIDNGDEKDGWISFLEFARYASAKIKTPEDYVSKRERLFLTDTLDEGSEGVEGGKSKPKRRTSKRPHSAKTPSFKSLSNTEKDSPSTMIHSVANALQAASFLNKTLEHAKHSTSGRSSFAKPKSLLARFNDKLNAEEEAKAANRRMSLFKAASDRPETAMVEGSKEHLEAKIADGKIHVSSNRQTAFMARLKRDEDEILTTSLAAENMNVSTELSQELLDMRKNNNRMGMRRSPLPEKKRKHHHHYRPVQQTVSPFSFAEIPIHHVKPGSYAAQCETKRLLELETCGKPLNATENKYVDTRVFSINNLNTVMKTVKAKASADNNQQESSGLLTPRQRFYSDEECHAVGPSECLPPTSTPHAEEPEYNNHDHDREEDKRKAKFRQKIEKYIEEGQASNHQHQKRDRVRPKSASTAVTATSLEDFEKQQSSSQVQTFFNNYADVDRGGHAGVLPTASLFDKYATGGKSGSLELSLRSGKVVDKYSSDRRKEHTARPGSYYHGTHKTSPYVDDISTEPHLARGKAFIDHGDRDKRRFGNVRFSEQVFNTRPRSGHFPSKHDTLQGKHQYELWDSKRNNALQKQNMKNQIRNQNSGPLQKTYSSASPVRRTKSTSKSNAGN
jgi:hypothetical protein